MSKVISFATQKGGAGKTTLLMLTAAALHNRSSQKVLVIDSDPQLSVKNIYKQEGNSKSYDVFAFNWGQPTPEVNFEKVITLAKRKYEIILMDLPGNIKSEEFYYSILQSDILMVPIVASTLDMNATMGFLHRIPDFNKEKGSPLEVFGVVNKREKTLEQKFIHELYHLENLKLFDSEISYLVRYKRQISTVFDIVDPMIEDDEFNIYFKEFVEKCEIHL